MAELSRLNLTLQEIAVIVFREFQYKSIPERREFIKQITGK